jgi:hypothetical protein
MPLVDRGPGAPHGAAAGLDGLEDELDRGLRAATPSGLGRPPPPRWWRRALGLGDESSLPAVERDVTALLPSRPRLR